MLNGVCVKEIPFVLDCQSAYDCVAFDGYYYYFLFCHQQYVLKTDVCFQCVHSYPLHRKYTSLCFDKAEKCFWASYTNSPYTLYKLSIDLCELGTWSVPKSANGCGVLSSLSYDDVNNALMFVLDNQFVQYKISTNNSCVQYDDVNAYIFSASCVFPFFALTLVQNNLTKFVLLDCAGHVQHACDMPCDFIVKNVYMSCEQNVQNQLLLDVFIVYKCGQRCCKKVLAFPLDCACTSCPQPCSPPLCFPVQPCDGGIEILHSIALQETALAHILNAEGEKIQKAVACACSVEELLCVNKSVQDTIHKVTALEQTLALKLTSVLDMPSCCPTDCCAQGKML